ncbi:MAG: PAS domain-containing protein, partial [Acidobacteriota bacterium]
MRPLHWISGGYGLLYSTLWLVHQLGVVEMTGPAWVAGVGLAVLGQAAIIALAILRPPRSRDWQWLGIGTAACAVLQFGVVSYLAPTVAPVLMIAWLVNLSHVAGFLGLRIAAATATAVTAVVAGAVLLAVETADTPRWMAILAIFVGAQLYTIASHVGLHHRIWKRELQSRELIARAPVGLFRTDAEGDCLYVNHHWQHLAGLSLVEALGDGWAGGLHPDDRDRVFAAWHDAMVAATTFESE